MFVLLFKKKYSITFTQLFYHGTLYKSSAKPKFEGTTFEKHVENQCPYQNIVKFCLKICIRFVENGWKISTKYCFL